MWSRTPTFASWQLTWFGWFLKSRPFEMHSELDDGMDFDSIQFKMHISAEFSASLYWVVFQNRQEAIVWADEEVKSNAKWDTVHRLFQKKGTTDSFSVPRVCCIDWWILVLSRLWCDSTAPDKTRARRAAELSTWLTEEMAVLWIMCWAQRIMTSDLTIWLERSERNWCSRWKEPCALGLRTKLWMLSWLNGKCVILTEESMDQRYLPQTLHDVKKSSVHSLQYPANTSRRQEVFHSLATISSRHLKWSWRSEDLNLNNWNKICNRPSNLNTVH